MYSIVVACQILVHLRFWLFAVRLCGIARKGVVVARDFRRQAGLAMLCVASVLAAEGLQ